MALRRLVKRPSDGSRGWGRNGGTARRGKRRDLSFGEGGRVRAFVVPMAPGAVKGAGSKTAPREGRQGVGGAMSEARQARPGSADEATQGTEARRRERRWTEASIWTERMVSALVNGVKAWPRAGRRPDPWGGKWFSLIDKVYRPSTLAAAWTRVERNKGAAGVDGQGIERFAAQAERYLTELHEQLKDGSYRPAPVKRVEIPKGDGKTRPLGIPTVQSLPRAKAGDRVVQTALKLAIEPVFEAQFRPGSYGFRPGRSCKAALREVDRLLKAGYSLVVDADLKSYSTRSRTTG